MGAGVSSQRGSSQAAEEAVEACGQALADSGLVVDPDVYSAAAAAEFRVQSIDRVGMQLLFGAAFDLPYLTRINRTVDHLVAITG